MSVARQSAPRARIVLLVMVALAAVLRFATLDQQGLESDEIVTRWLMQQDFGHMLHSVTQTEQTPFLFYVLSWPLGHVEPPEIWLRVVPATAGVATVGLAYVAARDLVSQKAGLIAAGLTATNPLLIWFSQEARSYALAVALSTAALVFFIRASKSHRRRDVVVWALLSTLAFATHYFAAFLVLPQAIWLLKRRQMRPSVLAASVPVAVVAFAHAALALQQRCGDEDFSAQSLTMRLVRLPKHDLMGFTIEDGPPEILLASAGLLLGLLLAGIALSRVDGKSRQGALLVSGMIAATLAMVVALAVAGIDYVNSRNLIVTLVPALVVVAAVCAAPRAGRLGTTAAIGLSLVFLGGVGVVVADGRRQREDWRGLTAALGPRKSRVLVVTPGSGPLPFQAYTRGTWHIPAAGFRTREIVLAALPVVDSEIRVQPPLPQSDRAPAPPVRGFVLKERRQTSSYVLLRYVSPRAVLVTRRGLARKALDTSQPASVIVQLPSGPDERVALTCGRYRR